MTDDAPAGRVRRADGLHWDWCAGPHDSFLCVPAKSGVNVERLAYALAVVGPVDMDDSNEAWRAYATDIAREYETTEWPNGEWNDAGPVKKRP